MRYSNHPAIIFGPDSITGLGVARNLGRNGVKVYCVTEQKNEIAYSKYCKGFYAIPHIEKNNYILRAFLSNVKAKLQHPSVLFPCSDFFCISLSQIRDELNSEINDQYVTFGKSQTIETLVNKRKFYQSLDRYGVPHPITYFPETMQDIEDISNQVEYPTYIKPSISQLFANLQKKGLTARSQAELAYYYNLASKYDGSLMIQEIIPGPATNMFGINGYFDKTHNPQAFFAYHRLREYPQRFANSSLMESIPISDVLCMKETIEDYLKKLRYHGIFDAEFKKDQRDGNYKLLEINARSWWQNSFPTKCGINLILMAYLDALDKKIEYMDTYEVGAKWLFLTNDLLSTMEMLNARQTSVIQWLSSLKKTKDYAYLSPDDPLPWITSPLFISHNYAQALSTRAFTRLIEIASGKNTNTTPKNTPPTA